jgi:hypothetical protein
MQQAGELGHPVAGLLPLLIRASVLAHSKPKRPRAVALASLDGSGAHLPCPQRGQAPPLALVGHLGLGLAALQATELQLTGTATAL